MCPVFPSFPCIWETLFPVSRCKLCLRYTAGDFNENPSMRARASERSCNFCEQFEQRPKFASTFKLDGTIRYRSLSRVFLVEGFIPIEQGGTETNCTCHLQTPTGIRLFKASDTLGDILLWVLAKGNFGEGCLQQYAQ